MKKKDSGAYFGKKLKKARLARGESLEDAAAATRMRPEKIAALEASDLSTFPNPAYAKSFLILYGRHLGVDVKSIAAEIETYTQVCVEEYGYLTNADALQAGKAVRGRFADSTYVPPSTAPSEKASFLSLAIVGSVIVAGIFAFTLWSKFNQLREVPPVVAANTPAKPEPKPAEVKPALIKVEPKPPAPAVVVAPPPAPTPIASTVELTDSTPAVAAVTPASPQAIPPVDNTTGQPVEVRRAIAVPPPVKLAVNDDDALQDLAPKPAPTPAEPMEPVLDEENHSYEDTILIEPHRKTYVTIRKSPDAKPEYEDFLYPSASGLRLPAGKWFIEVREGDAVEISKNGHRITYNEPGVTVE